jgi:hypothetical protein
MQQSILCAFGRAYARTLMNPAESADSFFRIFFVFHRMNRNMYMKLSKHRNVLAIGFATLGVVASAANFTSIPLPSLDTDIRTFTDGVAYDPLFPSSSQTFAGVPFSFQADSHGNTAFIGTGPGGNSLNIPVNVFGVTSVYALINTAFGALGVDVGSVTFNGSLGDTFTVQLVEGQNVRDHFFGSFVNTTTDPTTTQAVFGVNSAGNAHLDMQDFVLPSNFANETLDSIVFTDLLKGGNGEPFIAGATGPLFRALRTRWRF